ncbi:formyltetrahydrofolate deformylase [Helicobacter himalayensis]|uniref:formyltetrahydrofolate deformylase n=1 Tax=Helicobacter himalayensis TaxID=1591088 RepID=UPI000833F5DA|nr:formyltetrahydrofolate deformylase [Helicobacter himalayensis]
MQDFHILISAPDRQGLVFEIARCFFELGFNIARQDEFVDLQNKQFFLRTHIQARESSADSKAEEKLRTSLENILCANAPCAQDSITDSVIKDFGAQDSGVEVKIIPAQRKKSLVLFCTKENHCLGDILLRYDSGELNAKIKAIISNHSVLEPLARKFDVRFLHIEPSGLSLKDKRENEIHILEALQGLGEIDFLVLAKYMRILTPEFIKHFPNRILNIHHSFLPAFIGANPYKQAYERGVKIIGASAHFVTENLDEGPIITQDTIAIDHSYTWREMQRAGGDVEKSVLARALKLALEDRIFVFQNRTIIF